MLEGLQLDSRTAIFAALASLDPWMSYSIHDMLFQGLAGVNTEVYCKLDAGSECVGDERVFVDLLPVFELGLRAGIRQALPNSVPTPQQQQLQLQRLDEAKKVVTEQQWQQVQQQQQYV